MVAGLVINTGTGIRGNGFLLKKESKLATCYCNRDWITIIDWIFGSLLI